MQVGIAVRKKSQENCMKMVAVDVECDTLENIETALLAITSVHNSPWSYWVLERNAAQKLLIVEDHPMQLQSLPRTVT